MTPLSLVGAEPAVVAVRSTVLGDLDVRSDNVMTFPGGILGFPECRQFALLRGARDDLFWLQSMEYPTLAFLLVDPFTIEEHYSLDVAPWQIADLGGADPSDIGLLAIVTLPGSPAEQATVNLQGPIVINFRTRRAKQIVCQEADYSVRRPVDLTRLVA